jgi:hypothetical protein
MTNQFSAVPDADGHAGPDLLAGYAAGGVDEAVAWSIEAHVMACAPCRSVLSAQADAGRLARNRSALQVRLALGEDGRARRLLRRCGVPDHLVRLLAATPSLRRSWLLSVAGVLAVVAGETVLARYSARGAPGGYPDQAAVLPFLLIAPLLALASVAAAFLPAFDPAYRLAVAAPFSGFALLLARAVSALAAAMIPVTFATLAVPGPRWLPAAFLLPSLAVCAVALAAASLVGPAPAAVAAGAVWVLPVVLLSMAHLPLTVVQWHGQAAAAAVALAAATVLWRRHDRFELGW